MKSRKRRKRSPKVVISAFDPVKIRRQEKQISNIVSHVAAIDVLKDRYTVNVNKNGLITGYAVIPLKILDKKNVDCLIEKDLFGRFIIYSDKADAEEFRGHHNKYFSQKHNKIQVSKVAIIF